MSESVGVSVRGVWPWAAVLAGAAYGLIGILFALPVTHAIFWRRAAWVASIIVFVAHIAYERRRLRSGVREAAAHVALGAALGAFWLAVGANVHWLLTPSAHARRGLLLIALVAWPLITAVPALVVALVIASMLVRNQEKRNA